MPDKKLTPQQIEARIAASLKRNAEKLIPSGVKAPYINNEQLLKDTGLRIIHFNRTDFGGRSMTLAYQATNSMAKVATSVTHPDDTFTKKVGTKTAVEAFMGGRAINIPIPREWQGHVSDFLITLFSPV